MTVRVPAARYSAATAYATGLTRVYEAMNTTSRSRGSSRWASPTP